MHVNGCPEQFEGETKALAEYAYAAGFEAGGVNDGEPVVFLGEFLPSFTLGYESRKRSDFVFVPTGDESLVQKRNRRLKRA